MSIIVALFLGLTVSAEEIFRDRKILKRELNELIKMVENKKGPFNRSLVEEKLKEYEKIKKVAKND